jgi:hypothetical protein
VTGGSAGWFALRGVPAAWATEDGASDGAENFFLAGPGLGSPDDTGARTSLLGNVPDLVTLDAAGAADLIGRQTCAVVYSDELAAGDRSDLTGATLGVIAFSVVSGDAGAMDRPSVTVQILDARETCVGAIATFSEAPAEP